MGVLAVAIAVVGMASAVSAEDGGPSSDESYKFELGATSAPVGGEFPLTGYCRSFGIRKDLVGNAYFVQTDSQSPYEFSVELPVDPATGNFIDEGIVVPDSVVPGDYQVLFSCRLDDTVWGDLNVWTPVTITPGPERPSTTTTTTTTVVPTTTTTTTTTVPLTPTAVPEVSDAGAGRGRPRSIGFTG
ncbi:MAG: hypothetical protein KDB26_15835 [Microthrixaceae bacterium]|nr:hypothetical protein [Microthrixaceae bacterium]